MLKAKGAVQMATILALPDKPIQIDDEDFERVSAFTWRVVGNVAGRIGRKVHATRYVGLAAMLLGKRPGQSWRLEFRDKDLRNFSKSNIYWSDDCIYCARPSRGHLGACIHCLTDFNINQKFKVSTTPREYRIGYWKTIQE
jgi:hypothetical protein